MPEGTTADRRGNDGRGGDSRGSNDDTEREAPSAEDQINNEIAVTEVTEWWRSLFGDNPIEQQHESGGGGTGGQFMFANINELNGVIKQWEQERSDIETDRDVIADLYWMIKEPAGDDMSLEVTDATKNSLASMWDHSGQMWSYADNYIKKLYASRDQMDTMDEGQATRMKGVY